MLILLCGVRVALKLIKSHLVDRKIEYLGEILMPDRLTVASENVDAMNTAVFQTTSKQMRLFSGAYNCDRRFV